MKIILEDDYKVVTIEDTTGGEHISSLVDLCRAAALALEYHPNTVDKYLPDE